MRRCYFVWNLSKCCVRLFLWELTWWQSEILGKNITGPILTFYPKYVINMLYLHVQTVIPGRYSIYPCCLGLQQCGYLQEFFSGPCVHATVLPWPWNMISMAPYCRTIVVRIIPPYTGKIHNCKYSNPISSLPITGYYFGHYCPPTSILWPLIPI